MPSANPSILAKVSFVSEIPPLILSRIFSSFCFTPNNSVTLLKTSLPLLFTSGTISVALFFMSILISPSVCFISYIRFCGLTAMSDKTYPSFYPRRILSFWFWLSSSHLLYQAHTLLFLRQLSPQPFQQAVQLPLFRLLLQQQTSRFLSLLSLQSA